MPIRKRSSLPFAESMSLIWLAVWNAVWQRGANGAAAMAGRTHADQPHVSGADDR
jgi:hypothetical protein